MRKTVAILVFLFLGSLSGCQFIADTLFGGVAEKYDSSRPKSERRDAYQNSVDQSRQLTTGP